LIHDLWTFLRRTIRYVHLLFHPITREPVWRVRWFLQIVTTALIGAPLLNLQIHVAAIHGDSVLTLDTTVHDTPVHRVPSQPCTDSAFIQRFDQGWIEIANQAFLLLGNAVGNEMTLGNEECFTFYVHTKNTININKNMLLQFPTFVTLFTCPQQHMGTYSPLVAKYETFKQTYPIDSQTCTCKWS
jgi:hypothetical protein